MAYDRVASQFTSATNYASAATGRADSFITSLNAVVAALRTPELTIDVAWPEAPALETFSAPTVTMPAADFPIDSIGSAPTAPSTAITAGVLPTAPVLPEYTYTPGTTPARPVLGELAGAVLPAAPESWAAPEMPALININVRPFAGVDAHSDWLARLNDAPDDLVLDAPRAFVPPDHGNYSSAMLTEMVGLLRQRMTGGTGLAPAVEQAIWDRARSREAALHQTAVDDIVRTAEGRGFSLPTGAMHAALREANKNLVAKSAELSRDIAIKQAELEQTNAKHAIEQGIQLEARLIDYANSVEQRAFEAARAAADNAVQVYNAIVSKYRMVLEKYSTFANIYKTLIDGEQSKVAVYRAEVDAERAKSEINRALVDQLQAQIAIRSTRIDLYKAEVEAANTALGADKLKIEAFGEHVRAYAAEIGAETARVEAYKAQLQGNAARADVYKTEVDAYAAALSASAAAARARADAYSSEVQGFAAKTQAYATRVSASAERLRALLGIENLKLDATKLETEQAMSNNQLQIENFKTLIAQYEAAKQLGLSQTKLLSDNYFTLKSIVADAAKVGAQVNAQLAASAYGTLHASASVSGQDSTSTNFSYSGDTADTRAAPSYG